jgi:hypothetical protein
VSSAYALAAVTAVLRDRLRSRLVAAGVGAVTGSVDVSAVPPDLVDTGEAEPARLNLFLHNVTFNQGWRNVGQPVRDGRGTRVAAPPLALDLHYLLTAYGAEPYHAEILLGHASQELHENPVLTPEQVRGALGPEVPDPTLPAPVAASRLADQAEHLRIVPVSVQPDELFRLWTALQAQYRPTVAFQVCVVLVDSQAAARSAPPVVERVLAVEPLRRPRIDAVEDATDPRAPILASSTVVVRGAQLAAPSLTVLVGGVALAPASVTDAAITLDLADLPSPPRVGAATVEVVHGAALGMPPTTRAVVASAPAALPLRPSATFTHTVTGTTAVDGEDRHDGTITATVDPPVGRAQRVAVLLNERGAPAGRPARAHALPAPDGNGLDPAQAAGATVTVAFTGVASGAYVARVQVDGVDSPLATGADGRFETPAVVLP